MNTKDSASSLSSEATTKPLPFEKLPMSVEMPMPRQHVSMERQTAETPISGLPARVTAVSAMKSPIEFAHDRTVTPRMRDRGAWT